MSLINKMARIGRNQAKNLINAFSGLPLTMPSLSSATLDIDDVELANQWLLKPQQCWHSRQDIVYAYEKEFARWNGSKFAFAFMGGRVALSACIYALNLKPGDEVILPAYTCVVVPNAFHYAGIKPVYCDIELDTYGLDIAKILSKITTKTRAILLHHLYGLVCRDYAAILELSKNMALKVIEDCCHATGASYKGQNVGNLGDVAFYSSEQSKIFNTVVGGIAVTNDKKLADRIEEYYNRIKYPDGERIQNILLNISLNYYQFKHPYRWFLGDLVELKYGHKRIISTTSDEEKGIQPKYYNQKMPAPLAALGLNQLKKIGYYNQCRQKTAKNWDLWCYTKGYRSPLVIDQSVPVYLRYPILVEPEKKENLSWLIKELGIKPGVWFVSNIHPVKSSAFKDYECADFAVKSCINFPCLI